MSYKISYSIWELLNDQIVLREQHLRYFLNQFAGYLKKQKIALSKLAH